MKLVWAYLLSGALAALVSLGFLTSVERAVVELTVMPQRVQVEGIPLAGGSAGAGLATKEIVASVTEQQTVSTSVVQVPASAAGGQVTFMCSPMTSCPNGYTVAAGTILGSTTGIEFRTLSTVSFPSCAPSSPVRVVALTTGAAGNAGAGTVVYGQFPGYIHVNNPWPILGGVDAHAVHLVQQSDLDTAGSNLTARVSSELGTQLQAQAGALSFIATGAPEFNTSSDARVGDSAPVFTVTVTGTLRAIAYSAKEADALLRHALSQRVAAGYRLTADSIDATYSVQTTGEVTGSATGYMIPSVNTRALVDAVRGKSLSQARSQIDQSVPGATAELRSEPFALPWLPLLADHISVVVLTR